MSGEEKTRRRPFAVSFLAVALALAGIDLWTKAHWFDLHEPGGPTAAGPALLGDWLRVHTAWNTGIPWGQLSGSPRVLAVVSGLAIAIILWIFYRRTRSADPFFTFGLSLILGGAAGNMYDRSVLPGVRDWILFVPELPVIGQWPVFNVADAGICVGAGLVLLSVLFASEEPAADAAVS